MRFQLKWQQQKKTWTINLETIFDRKIGKMSVVLLEQLQDIIVKTFSSPEITDLTVMMEIKNICTSNIVCTPLPICYGRGGLSLWPNFQKVGGGFHRILIFRGGLLGKRRVTFFREGGCSFYIKNKLKSEIFNKKKSLQTKMFFSVITKNLNWEILTKNLVTFKRWDEAKDEKF